MLHGDNASVGILAAASGLLQAATYRDIAVQMMSDEIAKNTHEKSRLMTLRDKVRSAEMPTDVRKLQVDPDKNLLLALAFPDSYMEALALVTGRGVSFEIWGSSGPSMDQLEQYLFAGQNCLPVFTRAALKPAVSTARDDFEDVNVFLKCNKVLRQLGYAINLQTFELDKLEDLEEPNNIESPAPQLSPNTAPAQAPHLDIFDTSHVFVDLYNWFCSCDTFDQSATSFAYTAKEILQDTTGDNALLHVLRKSPCKHPKVLPMCRHLLAAAMMLMNWDVCKRFGLFELS